MKKEFRKRSFWKLVTTLFIIGLILNMETYNINTVYAQDGGGGGTTNPTDTTDLSTKIAGTLHGFKKWVIKGGYVAAGTGMRNLGKGKIKIQGIPPSATINAAYLYWNIISPKDTLINKKGIFDGHAIVGSLIGTTASPCWGTGYSRSYRADVTKLVTTAVHTYELTHFASGITSGIDPSTSSVIAPLLEGATLVITYKQSSYPMTTIFLYNGAVTTYNSRGAAKTTVSGLPHYPSYLAYTTFIVADGQTRATKASYFNDSLIKSADITGTDPKWTGGRYAFGNLWDTEVASSTKTAKRGISVGSRIPANSSSVSISVSGGTDCLVHVAQVLSVSNGQSDTDGDGLIDSWEANGYKTVNLPALGANPFHKDIFMEIDWMADQPGEFSHKPSATVINQLVAIFKNGDVLNPDKSVGIALHVDVSNSIPHRVEFTTTPGCGDLFTKLETTKTANMIADRYKTHHYQLWVHDLCPELGSTSGYAQNIPGDDSFVSLGSWQNQGDTEERIGTAMHELGHDLNLRHGHPSGSTTALSGESDDPYVPNHLSVMSYLYQVTGLLKDGSSGLFDYQRWDLPALNENCLDETTGLATLGVLDTYGLRWVTNDGIYHQDSTSGAANGPVDWNSNAVDTETCTNISINYDDPQVTLDATKEEWRLLVYNGGAVGLGLEFGLGPNGEKIPVYNVEPPNFHELTLEQAQLLNDTK